MIINSEFKIISQIFLRPTLQKELKRKRLKRRMSLTINQVRLDVASSTNLNSFIDNDYQKCIV